MRGFQQETEFTVRSYICGFPQGEAMADSGQRVLATLAGSRRPR